MFPSIERSKLVGTSSKHCEGNWTSSSRRQREDQDPFYLKSIIRPGLFAASPGSVSRALATPNSMGSFQKVEQACDGGAEHI